MSIVALLKFLDHLTGLASVLELIEALIAIDILLNGCYVVKVRSAWESYSVEILKLTVDLDFEIIVVLSCWLPSFGSDDLQLVIFG